MKSVALKISFVTMILNILVMPFSGTISILFGYLCLVTTALVPFELLYNSGNRLNKKQFVIMLAFLVIMFLNSPSSFLEIQMGDLENIIKAIVVFIAFLVSISVSGVTFSIKDLQFYFDIIRGASIVFILYTILPFGFRYTPVDEYGNVQLTLSMGNPNATAAKLLFFVIMLLIETSLLKNKRKRRLNGLVIIGLLYTLFRFESRTSFICAVLITVLIVVVQMRVKSWMAKTAWLIPALFIPIQLLLAKIPGFVFLNKTVSSGREDLYTAYISDILSSPAKYIFGDFFGNQLENNHNVVFTFLLNFGIVGCVLYYLFWKIEIDSLNKISTKIENYSWLAIIVFIVHSMAESAVMSGSFTFGILAILLNRMNKDRLDVTPYLNEKYNIYLYDKSGEIIQEETL